MMTEPHRLLATGESYSIATEELIDCLVSNTKLPIPVYDETALMGDMPRVVGQLVQLQKVTTHEGESELWGGFEWTARPQRRWPYLTIELEPVDAETGEPKPPAIREVATTENPAFGPVAPITAKPAFETTTVKRCGECPLLEPEGGPEYRGCCAHPRAVAGLNVDVSRPPVRCPLRSKPMLIRVADGD